MHKKNIIRNVALKYREILILYLDLEWHRKIYGYVSFFPSLKTTSALNLNEIY